jgi:hypothetical protein
MISAMEQLIADSRPTKYSFLSPVTSSPGDWIFFLLVLRLFGIVGVPPCFAGVIDFGLIFSLVDFCFCEAGVFLISTLLLVVDLIGDDVSFQNHILGSAELL